MDPSANVASTRAYKTIPGPLEELRFLGILDLMDETDLHAHLPKDYASKLIKTCKEMRARSPEDDRFKLWRVDFPVEFSLSVNDILNFKGTIKERADAQTNPCMSPCFVFPFRAGTYEQETAKTTRVDPDASGLPEILDHNAIVVVAVCDTELNEFTDIFTEGLKLGSSLSEDYSRAQKHIDPDNAIVQAYLRSSLRGTLTFNAFASKQEKKGSPKKAWTLAPLLTEPDLIALSTEGLVDVATTLEKGVLKVAQQDMLPVSKSLSAEVFANGSENKIVYYLPEEHGLSEMIKRHMPSIISNVRVFSEEIGVNHSQTYLRLSESCYESAKIKCAEELAVSRRRESAPRDMHFWLGYKVLGEDWEDSAEKERLLQLPAEELFRKRLVRFRVNLCWLSLDRSREDWFMSHKKTVGAWLPTAVSYVDALTCDQPSMTDEEAKTMGVPEGGPRPIFERTIPARQLPYYLKEHQATRRKVKQQQQQQQHKTNANPLFDYREKLVQV